MDPTPAACAGHPQFSSGDFQASEKQRGRKAELVGRSHPGKADGQGHGQRLLEMLTRADQLGQCPCREERELRATGTGGNIGCQGSWKV